MTRLVEHPDLGHRRADLTSDGQVRFWSVGPTLVAYRRRVQEPEVLFVERGARDWGRVLEDGA